MSSPTSPVDHPRTGGKSLDYLSNFHSLPSASKSDSSHELSPQYQDSRVSMSPQDDAIHAGTYARKKLPEIVEAQEESPQETPHSQSSRFKETTWSAPQSSDKKARKTSDASSKASVDNDAELVKPVSKDVPSKPKRAKRPKAVLRYPDSAWKDKQVSELKKAMYDRDLVPGTKRKYSLVNAIEDHDVASKADKTAKRLKLGNPAKIADSKGNGEDGSKEGKDQKEQRNLKKSSPATANGKPETDGRAHASGKKKTGGAARDTTKHGVKDRDRAKAQGAEVKSTPAAAEKRLPKSTAPPIASVKARAASAPPALSCTDADH